MAMRLLNKGMQLGRGRERRGHCGGSCGAQERLARGSRHCALPAWRLVVWGLNWGRGVCRGMQEGSAAARVGRSAPARLLARSGVGAGAAALGAVLVWLCRQQHFIVLRAHLLRLAVHAAASSGSRRAVGGGASVALPPVAARAAERREAQKRQQRQGGAPEHGPVVAPLGVVLVQPAAQLAKVLAEAGGAGVAERGCAGERGVPAAAGPTPTPLARTCGGSASPQTQARGPSLQRWQVAAARVAGQAGAAHGCRSRSRRRRRRGGAGAAAGAARRRWRTGGELVEPHGVAVGLGRLLLAVLIPAGRQGQGGGGRQAQAEAAVGGGMAGCQSRGCLRHCYQPAASGSRLTRSRGKP